MVYVDPLMACVKSKRWPYSQSCHLFADTDSELFTFASILGLKRSWLQSHRRTRHYDLTEGKRKRAVALGAKEVTFQFTAEFMQLNPHPAHRAPAREIPRFRNW